MRIVVDPDSLRATAGVLKDGSTELTGLSASLLSLGLPAMPADIAAEAQDTLGSTGSSWRAAAQEYSDISIELRLRALAAQFGGPWEALLHSYLAVHDQLSPLLDGPLSWVLDVGKGTSEIVAARIGATIMRDVDAVGLARLRYGAGSLQALNAWERLQQRVSIFTSLEKNPQFLDELFAGGTRTNSALKALLSPMNQLFEGGRIGESVDAAGKVFFPLALLGNAETLIGPGAHPQAWRNDVDKFFAVAGTVAAFPPFAAAFPEVSGAILIGQGVWQLGNFAYDHRQEIAHATVEVGHAAWTAADAGYHEAGHLLGGAKNEANSILGHVGIHI